MCESLIQIARECGKQANPGVHSDVYLIAYNDLKFITGTTEVYSTSISGLVDNIALSGDTKFVKYGSVKNAASIKETFTKNDNGTFSFQKELSFTLANMGSVERKQAAEKLISNPVAALIKLGNKSWVAMGLDGGFELSGVEGTVDKENNARVFTFSGADTEFTHVVDPTIINSLI
jgi:hypothetical protein